MLLSREDITLRKLNEDRLRAAKEAAEAACREEEIRHESAEHRRRIAQAIADTLALASSGRPVEDAFPGHGGTRPRRFREPGCRHLQRRGALGPNSPGRRLRRPPNYNPQEQVPDRPNDPGQGHRRSLRCRHSRCRERHGSAGGRQSCGGEPPGYRALLVTPIHRSRLYGYLALFYARATRLTGEDTELAHLFGQQVTLAELENAELGRAEKVAIENERSRLARDLHDGVAQTLFSASIVAEALPHIWSAIPAEGMRALDELRLWIRGALAELRTLLMELRPATLIDKPLPDLMRQLSEAAATRLRLPAICETSAQSEPPTKVKLALYRIAQEALNNMAKHSSASHVAVRYRHFQTVSWPSSTTHGF